MSFKIQILGSNSSLPAYGRHHTSQFVQVGNYYFLVDCGEGTQYQVRKYGVKASRINHILISHLHGDHFLGLMGMIYSFHLSGRTKTLNIYGQGGLDQIITTHLQYSNSSLNYKIDFFELDPENYTKIISNSTMEVFSFPLKHRIPCCGFLFKEKKKPRRIISNNIPAELKRSDFSELKKGKHIYDEEGEILFKNEHLTLPPKKSRSYAFCSDTSFDEDLIEYLKGVDLCYHETTFLNEMEKWARKTFHSTTYDAANIALKSKVGKLLIGHFSARYKEIDIFVNECREIFEESYPAIEGQIFDIKE